MRSTAQDKASRLRSPLALFALPAVWLLLSNASPASLLVGVPTVIAAYWVSRRLHLDTGMAPSAIGLLRFAPFFLVESVRGGLDVARRVFSPRLDVQPAFKQYRMHLPGPGARLLFTNTVSLLPGTLAADLNGDILTIHTLDETADLERELQRVETAVSRVFGAPA